jgi:hypothetical protein
MTIFTVLRFLSRDSLMFCYSGSLVPVTTYRTRLTDLFMKLTILEIIDIPVVRGSYGQDILAFLNFFYIKSVISST